MNRFDIYTILKQIRDGQKDNLPLRKENKEFLKFHKLSNMERLEGTEAEEFKEGVIEFLLSINAI